jgi:hypothetical protein
LDSEAVITFFSDGKVWLSVAAVVISIFTFLINYWKTKKTEQIKVVMEISTKLDEAENKIFDLEDQLKKSINEGIRSTSNNTALRRSIQDAELLYMNHWEFYAFLVNNQHIDNENIQGYLKDNFISGTHYFFENHPNYIDDKEKFKEIKKLLKKLGQELKHPTN